MAAGSSWLVPEFPSPLYTPVHKVSPDEFNFARAKSPNVTVDFSAPKYKLPELSPHKTLFDSAALNE